MYYVVCRELHEDGMPHLHACVEYREHYRGNVTSFDWEGRHPNKQDPRKWIACCTYVKKGGDYLEGPADAKGKKMVANIDCLAECASHDTMESWYSWCVSRKISYQYAEFFWRRVHQNYETIVDNEHPGKISEALEALEWNESWKTLVLIGKSGIGKTTWAKMRIPKPCLFVSHIDALRKFEIGYHKSILFDDVDFKHYPRTSQIHIVDFENPRHIHVRHTIASIPAGIVKVFTANCDPLDLTDEAVRRRCHVIRS